MKKLLITFFIFSLFLSACTSISPESAKESIIEGEQDRIPLLLQKLDDVENITIDSIRIFVEDEPMSGYLYTTWTYTARVRNSSGWGYHDKKITKPIIVEVTEIQKSKEHRGYIEWKTDWSSAYQVTR